MNIYLVIVIILAFFVILKVISTGISLYFGSPSGESSEKEIIQLLKKINIPKNKIFYDLGSGWGNVVIGAKKYGLISTGFEISPLPYIISKLRTLFNLKLSIEYKDLKSINYKKADIVYCYLLPGILDKISEKLKKELKTGSILISKNFSFKNFRALDTIHIKKNKYYIYKL